MIPATSFRGRNVAVFGLGDSGRAAALALTAGGASVAAWDDRSAAIDSARQAGVDVVDLRTADWQSFAALVLAPGVPLTHPRPHWAVVSAKAAGIEIIGDIEIFCRERRLHAPDSDFVAVTGTNGKSTTVALIAHLLAAAGRVVSLGGNIGTSVLELDPPSTGRTHVIECSSYQIDLAPSLAPSLGVLLNISPDHLNRHGSMPAYARIKERLVAAADSAVVGVDDNWTQAIADHVAASGRPLTHVSVRRPLAQGFYAAGETVFEASDGASTKIAQLGGIGTLRGAHNAQNALAALAVARTLGLEMEQIRAGLLTFPGLAHRLEEVGRAGSVLFINDSKATNVDAAAKALASFNRIYWIAGGLAKEGGVASLADFFPRIAGAYLIGEAAGSIASALGDQVPHQIFEALPEAVAAAAADAASDPAEEAVVLLSPACASFDQYKNFAERGDQFRQIAHDITEAKQGEPA